MKHLFPLTALCLTTLLPAAQPVKLELQPGDHICLIGNALAERMQHDNQWEALLHQRFSKHNLVVRNLGWSADEADFKTEFTVTDGHSKGDKASLGRPRSRDFGAPDKHLTHSAATVVLACFGFNEAFAGAAGLDKFKADVTTLITHTAAQKYDGKAAPRLVLVSPIAHEDHRSADLPDGKASSANLLRYTAALAELAAKHGVLFVDLFHPTLKAYASSPVRLTMNGVHLNPAGHKVVAHMLDEALFGKAGAPGAVNERLRAEITEKNYQWFMRYRSVNGYYIYGGRSRLKFADGDQTNADVMERERKILDEMCANRDQRIWRLAQGESVPAQIDDSNVSPFLEVKTYFGAGRRDAGKGKVGMSSKTAEAGEIKYLSAAEALVRFKLAPGYAVNCFASEEQFPELANAVQMAFDARGRLWVCTMPSYPQYQPLKDRSGTRSAPDDKIVILEDTDGDGRADKCKIFARGLHVPTGFEFANGGVYVAQQPDLVFLRDTDGDDQADVFERTLTGFDSGDSHHSISAFTLGPGGDLYFQEGTFFYTQVETPYGPVRNHNAGVYRFEPRTWKLDNFVSYPFANPWGISFDRWGQVFIADASGGANYFGTAFSGRTIYPDKHRNAPQWIKMRVRPTAGGEFVSSRHFPAEAQGNYLLNNCIGVQGVLQHKVEEKDSGFVGTEIEPLLLTDDTNFRPVDIEFGPDGALYLVDWHEPLIGHMQYSLRDPLRDKTHGRIYRVTYPGRPLLKAPQIAGAPIAKLLDLLREPEDRTRSRAKIELGARKTTDVMAALKTWMTRLDPKNPADHHAWLEALWVHQWHNIVNESLLKQLLRSPDPRVRAAAARVLCYWRDRVADPLGQLRTLVNDPHPRVRLEAVRTLSFFNSSKAAEIALESVNHPQDQYLKYCLDETMRTLERFK